MNTVRMLPIWVLAGVAVLVRPAGAATRYVNATNAAPLAPYTNWTAAATSIQHAVDAAASGDEILVAPGLYLLGGQPIVTPGEKTLALRSTSSRAAVVDAQWLSPCLEVWGTNSVVEGFTFRHGRDSGLKLYPACVVRDCLVTDNDGDGGGGVRIYRNALVTGCSIVSNRARYGGGVQFYYDDATGLVQNCDIRDNVATNYGGGLHLYHAGAVSNCWITGNRALLYEGGGAFVDRTGTVVNTVVAGNEAATEGGGLSLSGIPGGRAVHCTIVSNRAGSAAGGVFMNRSEILNCIVYFNAAASNRDLVHWESAISNCCTTVTLDWPNITNAPAFVDLAGGDYHLATASSCIDGGATNLGVAEDADGYARPAPGTPGGLVRPDIGAYEYGFHLNGLRFAGPGDVDYLWDVQRLGIYDLWGATSTMPLVWQRMASYTNGEMTGFRVHTQRVSAAYPPSGLFRLEVGRLPF